MIPEQRVMANYLRKALAEHGITADWMRYRTLAQWLEKHMELHDA